MFYDNLVIACEKAQCKVTPIVVECGGSKGSISNWKKGVAPNSDIVAKLAVRLNVSTDFLIFGKENRPPMDNLSADERELLTYYNVLDDMAKGKVVGRAEVLAEQAEEQHAEKEPKIKETRFIDIKYSLLPVSAGFGVELLDQEQMEITQIPDTPAARKADFMLTITGDSMEPLYHDGDRVLVQACECIDNGKIGIFCVNGKGYIKEKQDGWLVSKNPDRDDIRLHENDGTRCFGLVVGTA